MKTERGLRIAIYSQDGFGLGHMQRTTSIAWELYRLRPEASILTFSDSQLGQFFPISPHHDYIKLPSIAKEGPGNWKATHLRMSFPEILDLRKELISNALLHYAPDIFLVDHMPHRPWESFSQLWRQCNILGFIPKTSWGCGIFSIVRRSP